MGWDQHLLAARLLNRSMAKSIAVLPSATASLCIKRGEETIEKKDPNLKTGASRQSPPPPHPGPLPLGGGEGESSAVLQSG